MSDPYLGQIASFAFAYPPKNWMFCDGSRLAITQYQALFALIGTTYGGDGRTYFQVPDLRGRVAMSSGTGPGLTPRTPGQTGGVESVTLGVQNMPGHTHGLAVVPANATTPTPGATAALAQPNHGSPAVPDNIYSTAAPTAKLLPSAIGPVGGSAHDNRMPYTAIGYCICLSGIFPSRN